MDREQELREKVIEELSKFREELRTCNSTTYVSGAKVVMRMGLIDKAIDLLKGLEPRLVTAEDFNGDKAKEYGWSIPCWKEPKSPTRREGWTAICYGKWLADKGVARYWTDKPTDAQREAGKWE